jgi:sulfate transport system ATP-binding protein
VFVTHDQEEALEVSDRIAVMNKGKIEQIGTPEEVYDKPANPFVYNFLGNVNLFHARTEADALGEVLDEAAAGAAPARSKVAYVRPHDVEISRDGAGAGKIPARVDHVGFAGSVVNVQLQRIDTKELIEAELNRETYRELELKVEDRVFVRVRNARVFEGDDYSI